jgi:hypothetical protein
LHDEVGDEKGDDEELEQGHHLCPADRRVERPAKAARAVANVRALPVSSFQALMLLRA